MNADSSPVMVEVAKTVRTVTVVSGKRIFVEVKK
jgi:hypothetical protein